MPPGPLPNPHRRRRNAPTIPTTELPAGGRRGRRPKPPARLELGPSALEWWEWAWSTPQAAAWAGAGFTEVLARRASLEDDLAALARVDGLDLAELMDADTARMLDAILRRMAGLTGGRLAVLREMRELDDRLGLTPKALAALRWRIADTAPDEGPALVDEVEARRRDRRARALEAVEG